jgi:hypothetical protein
LTGPENRVGLLENRKLSYLTATGGVALTTHPHSRAEVKEKVELHTFTTLWAFVAYPGPKVIRPTSRKRIMNPLTCHLEVNVTHSVTAGIYYLLKGDKVSNLIIFYEFTLYN